MAENYDKFSISIDADVSALQSSIKAAQNTLAQFEAALKKATNIGEINYLQKNIDNLKGSIAQLNQQANNSGKAMGDASQSLINFSRIAQDAPYGILGVANNLNPMVESFQRLAKTEGGTKKALQAMVAGLSGPAGIGVAIGIISSLAITFSKQITAFFKGPTAELEEFRKKLKETADEIGKLIGQEQTKRTKGILLTELIVGGNPTQQAEALKQLQALYNQSDAIKKAKLGQDKAYYTTLVNQAAAQQGSIAVEKNNAAQLDLLYEKQIENSKKRNAELKNITTDISVATTSGLVVVKSIEQQKVAINAKYDELGNSLKADIDKLVVSTSKELAKVSLVPTFDKTAAKTTLDGLKEFSATLKYELSQQLLDYEKYKKRFAQIDTSYVSATTKEGPIKESMFSKKTKKDLADPEKNSLGKFLIADAKERQNIFTEEEQKVKQVQDAYNNFANVLANNVTNGLMNVFDALSKGASPLDAIGKMFVNIAQNIAAAIIQATIFQAILTAFPALKGLFAAGGILQGAFGGVSKNAEGGVAVGPHLGLIGEAGPEAILPLSKLSGMLNTSFNAGSMSGTGGGNGQFVLRGNDLVLALQRSNYSLNLRRGV